MSGTLLAPVRAHDGHPMNAHLRAMLRLCPSWASTKAPRSGLARRPSSLSEESCHLAPSPSPLASCHLQGREKKDRQADRRTALCSGQTKLFGGRPLSPGLAARAGHPQGRCAVSMWRALGAQEDPSAPPVLPSCPGPEPLGFQPQVGARVSAG